MHPQRESTKRDDIIHRVYIITLNNPSIRLTFSRFYFSAIAYFISRPSFHKLKFFSIFLF